MYACRLKKERRGGGGRGEEREWEGEERKKEREIKRFGYDEPGFINVVSVKEG